MCFTHCPGSIRTNTRFCRETNNVVNMRFVGLFWTQTLSHLRAFVANQVCRDNAFFWVCFVQTFTQTLRILLRFCADICPKNWPLRPLNGCFWHFDLTQGLICPLKCQNSTHNDVSVSKCPRIPRNL